MTSGVDGIGAFDGAFDGAFTVVIPAFNPGPLLRECLAGVAAQTHRPAWVVVVDDGSTDGTAESAAALFAEFGLPGEVLRQDNRGISAARNAGLDARKTDWVALLDADDLWLPEHLAEIARGIRACPDAAVVFAESIHFGADEADEVPIAGPFIPPLIAATPADDVHVLSEKTLDVLLRGLFMPVSATAFRLPLVGGTLRFDRELRTGEDRFFFLHLVREGPFVHVSRRTAGTRRHANNTTHVRHELKRHHDLLTLLQKILASHELPLGERQRQALGDLIATAVADLTYSSSSRGWTAYREARRRIATEVPRYGRSEPRALLRALAVGAGLRRSR